MFRVVRCTNSNELRIKLTSSNIVLTNLITIFLCVWKDKRIFIILVQKKKCLMSLICQIWREKEFDLRILNLKEEFVFERSLVQTAMFKNNRK